MDDNKQTESNPLAQVGESMETLIERPRFVCERHKIYFSMPVRQSISIRRK